MLCLCFSFNAYVRAPPPLELQTPGDQDSNQVFFFNASSGAITSASTGIAPGQCLSATGGATGGYLYTRDAAGAVWVLENHNGAEGA